MYIDDFKLFIHETLKSIHRGLKICKCQDHGSLLKRGAGGICLNHFIQLVICVNARLYRKEFPD
jgi:hypothetical protein